MVSNRSGGIARLELWVKRRFKQATRWYSWEQINFNAAVHHALRDTLDALQQLARAGAESEAWMRRLEIDTMRQRVEIESQRAALQSQRAAMEAMRTEMEGEHRAQILEVMARLADLSRELSKHNEQRIGEQRVCFKQLSLEMSEAEVLLERTRRDLETRLAKLEAEAES